MKVRYQADADLNQVILLSSIRHEPLLDFQSASSGGILGLSDPEVLARAASDGRVLVTHDRRTMPVHFARFVEHSRCPGLIVVPQSLSVTTAVDDLLLIWSATDSEEWVDRICILPL